MLLNLRNGIADYELNVLATLTDALDTLLAELERESHESPDPDGCFDAMEGAVGLGFAACQQYMSATFNFLKVGGKKTAFEFGPKHQSGRPIARIINDAANLWKHGDEIGDERTRQTKAALEAVCALDPGDSYLLGALRELVKPAPTRFTNVLPLLEAWRDDLVKSHPVP